MDKRVKGVDMPEPSHEQPVLKHDKIEKDPRRMSRRSQLLGTVLLCFVASFLGSWLLLRSGLVQLDATQTISNNREKIVLQEGEIVADVAKEVGPSTVSITTEQAGVTRDGRSAVQEGAGSGIVISKDGYILTNKHVIPEGVSAVTVTTSDGTEYTEVKVIGRDPSNDIAFLKIDDVDNLVPAKIGDSLNTQVGQKVVAIGNALGVFQNTVTAGIISGIGRPIQAGDSDGNNSENLENLFQTDAAINPGNSGGPLMNLKGEVIGVNTAIADEAQGIGFAIPINEAKGLIKSVLQSGKVVKPYLGVRYITLNAQSAKKLNLTTTKGAYVIGGNGVGAVVAGSPAEKAGIREKDIIAKVNGVAVNERTTLAGLLGAYVPGDEVELTVVRDGKEQTLKVKLEEFKR